MYIEKIIFKFLPYKNSVSAVLWALNDQSIFHKGFHKTNKNYANLVLVNNAKKYVKIDQQINFIVYAGLEEKGK